MSTKDNIIANFWIMLRRSSFWTSMIAFALSWVTMPETARLEWLSAHGLDFLSPYMFPLLLIAIVVAFIFPQIKVSEAIVDQAVKNVEGRQL